MLGAARKDSKDLATLCGPTVSATEIDCPFVVEDAFSAGELSGSLFESLNPEVVFR